MKHFKLTSAAVMVLLLLAIQSVGLAGVVGYNTTAVPANTDVYVSVPFTQAATATYTVSSVTAGVGVNVAGPLTVNQYQNVFYVRFTTGNATGQWSTITANTATQLTLAVTSFLPAVQTGDTFEVYRHQTLHSVFPDGQVGLSFAASANSSGEATQILIPGSGLGINKSSEATYYYRTVSGTPAWRKIGGGSGTNFNDAVLPPHTYFILRNQGATPLTFIAIGNVTASYFVDRISVAASQTDLIKTANNPVPMTYKALNLGGTALFVTSNTSSGDGDQIIVYDNAVTGINKSSAFTYFFRVATTVPASWRRVGGGATTNRDNDAVPAGAALQIRKLAGTAAVLDWPKNLPF